MEGEFVEEASSQMDLKKDIKCEGRWWWSQCLCFKLWGPQEHRYLVVRKSQLSLNYMLTFIIYYHHYIRFSVEGNLERLFNQFQMNFARIHLLLCEHTEQTRSARPGKEEEPVCKRRVTTFYSRATHLDACRLMPFLISSCMFLYDSSRYICGGLVSWHNRASVVSLCTLTARVCSFYLPLGQQSDNWY